MAWAVVPSVAAVAAIIGPVAPMVAVLVVPAVVMIMACVMLPMVTGGIISTVTRLADAHSADHER